MINIILLIVFLNNRLSYNLFSGNWNNFFSSYVLNLYRFSHRIKSDFFIISSVDLYVNSFLLNNWLINFLVVDFFSRFDNQLFSIIISNNWLFGERSQIKKLIIGRYKVNLFSVINDLFFVNWLEINFSRRILIFFSDDLFLIVNRFGNIR